MSVESGHPPTLSTRTGTATGRTRRDRCPGVLRPWPADDGALARVRLPGGRIRREALLALLAVAERHGDGRVHPTGRANLQLRGLPAPGTPGAAAVADAVEAAGLLPSRDHDRARNIIASPLTGLAGGRADLRPVIADLDAGLLADAALAELPGRFSLTLDDGRGDVAALGIDVDLGLVALDERTAQLRVGERWGAVVALPDAAAALLDLAREFLAVRGDGVDAPWHVGELRRPLAPARFPHPDALVRGAALPHGPVPGGVHHPVGTEGLSTDDVLGWGAPCATDSPDADLVVTPWRGVLVPHPPGADR